MAKRDAFNVLSLKQNPPDANYTLGLNQMKTRLAEHEL